VSEPRSIRELLGEHRFFTGLHEADLDLIAGCGRNVHYRPGDVLFEEGQRADTFWVIRRGRLAIETHAPERTAIILSTLADGDIAGWSWLFPPYRWVFDGRAVTELTAVALDGACLRGKCETDTDLGYRLMQRFARLAGESLQATRVQLLDLYRLPSDRPDPDG
jgi:CRP/FNR family transcriptional regulator, cyclic AMP receptor protein